MQDPLEVLLPPKQKRQQSSSQPGCSQVSGFPQDLLDPGRPLAGCPGTGKQISNLRNVRPGFPTAEDPELRKHSAQCQTPLSAEQAAKPLSGSQPAPLQDVHSSVTTVPGGPAGTDQFNLCRAGRCGSHHSTTKEWRADDPPGDTRKQGRTRLRPGSAGLCADTHTATACSLV